MLNKEKTLYKTKDGKLVPQEVELIDVVDEKKETVMAIPITRPELKKILGKNKTKGDNEELDKDSDAEIVLGYCKEPVYTKEEVENMKPSFCKNISATILHMSGLNMKNTFSEIKTQVVNLCFDLNKDERKELSEIINPKVVEKESKENK